MRIWRKILIFIAIFGIIYAEKIGDIANIIGVRSNQLIGYGLVIGLNGTGDKTNFTMQSVSNMLSALNIKADPNDIKSKNVAAVMITADLPSFARQGDRLDIKISSIGDAKSIEGGTLILTPLNAVDGKIYAMAQGAVTLGGSTNPLSGTISNGAVVEKEVFFDMEHQNSLTLSLKKSNFQNAIRIQSALNTAFGGKIARAVDSRTIKVARPKNLSSVEFLALIQELDVNYSKREEILIDEKSGTIISGVDIIVHPVALSNGDLSLKISKDFVDEKTASKIDDRAFLDEKLKILSSNGRPTTISSLLNALQKMGVSGKNIISIVGALKQSGAISAEINLI